MKSKQQIRNDCIKHMFAFSRVINPRLSKMPIDEIYLYHTMVEMMATRLRGEISRRAKNV